jgi:hypothetical protein
MREYTGFRDFRRNKIHLGDKVRGSYGIPGIKVESFVQKDEKEFFIMTYGHNPERCSLKLAIKYLHLEVE